MHRSSHGKPSKLNVARKQTKRYRKLTNARKLRKDYRGIKAPVREGGLDRLETRVIYLVLPVNPKKQETPKHYLHETMTEYDEEIDSNADKTKHFFV
eukprot:6292784-Amphidinium_carterae.1